MGETEDFEWDDDKDAANLHKHGLPLRLAVPIFSDPYLLEMAARSERGELRSLCVGKVEERVLTCVFTFRGHRRRLISLRAARRSERRDYLAQVDSRRDQG
jgi:uncharacterized protein